MNAPDRKDFIGGSDIGAIIGASPFKDPFGLYLEKRGDLPLSAEETKVQRRGKILEPAIAQLYEAEHGANLRAGLIAPIEGYPHFRAQVDARELVNDDICIPIEIKSASEFTRGKWGPSGTDEAPTYYCAQLHWQMMATEAPFGRIVALLGLDDLRVYTIEADRKVQAFLLEQATDFWRRVQEKDPPPVNFAHPTALDTMQRLFGAPKGTEIVKGNEKLRAWRDVYLDAAEHIKAFESTRDTAKAHMLAFMRDAAILDFDDGQMLERKVVKRKGYTVADTEYVDARIKKTRATVPALTEEAA